MIQRWYIDSYGVESEDANGQWIEYKDHEQALAEKDAEIVRWKAAHDEMVSRNRLLRDRPDLPADRIRAHDEWVEKYQQLMKQAVSWARYIMSIDDNTWESYKVAEIFLAKPEVQAFLKERDIDLEADPFGDVIQQFYKEREGE